MEYGLRQFQGNCFRVKHLTVHHVSAFKAASDGENQYGKNDKHDDGASLFYFIGNRIFGDPQDRRKRLRHINPLQVARRHLPVFRHP